MAKVQLWRFMQNVQAQEGDKYVFGAQASPDDRNPGEFDAPSSSNGPSSSRPSRRGSRSTPGFVDDSARPLHSDRAGGGAFNTQVALLFRDESVTGFGHVVISMGDNQRTFEAMGSDYGMRFGQIHGRTGTSARLIPEMDYEAKKEPAPRVERAAVFGKKGGRLGFMAAARLETEEARERLLRLLRRADSETGAGILDVVAVYTVAPLRSDGRQPVSISTDSVPGRRVFLPGF